MTTLMRLSHFQPKKIFRNDVSSWLNGVKSMSNKRCFSESSIVRDSIYTSLDSSRVPIRRSVHKVHPEAYDANLPFYGGERHDYLIRILLVRHGESYGNKDKAVLKSRSDHSIPLTEKGLQQARGVGAKINEFYMAEEQEIKQQCAEAGIPYEPKKRHRRLWTSPYKRARETADQIMDVARDWITDRREHILLGEQQFGLFEGHTTDAIHQLYPQEFKHFTKCIESEGRFWARMPLGESRFDVAKRVHQAFGSFHRDAQYHGINDIIVVSHGVTIRALIMMWLHRSPEWFEREENPQHCSIRLLEDNIDKGYVFEGYAREESSRTHSMREKLNEMSK